MKYFFSTITLIVILFSHGAFVHAQTTACSPITSDNFQQCCYSTNDGGNACNDYISGSNSSPGQLNSAPALPTGTISTTAVNSGAATASTAGQSSAASASSVQTCSPGKFNTLLDIAIWIKCIIGVIIIPGIFSLAFVIFLWGVLKFIRSSEKTDKEDGKRFIYMGLIGLFVMVSVWGIIKIVATTLGINSTVPMLQTDYLNPNKASGNTPASITNGAAN